MTSATQIKMVGYPDFWAQARQIDQYYFDQMPGLVERLNRIIKYSESQPLAKLVQALAKMVWDSAGAVEILCLNGYGLDALRLSRSMFEGAVTAAYLVKHPDELDDYLQFTKISAKRLLDYREQYPSPGLPPVVPEKKAAILARYEAVRSRYETNGRLRGEWCRVQFRQMVADVGLDAWYPGFYHIASAATHMNARGLYMHHSTDPDCKVMQSIAPSPENVSTSLVAARLAIQTALGAYSEVSEFKEIRIIVHEALENFVMKIAETNEEVL
jgi:hypothetical protein